MIKVIGKKITEAKKGQGAISYVREYLEHDGLACKQTKDITAESDYVGTSSYRISQDNGRTYGPWLPVEKESFSVMYGSDEMLSWPTYGKVWNPHHGHYVATGFCRYFIDGHEAAYEKYWNKGERNFFDHQTIQLFRKGETVPFSEHLIKYEEGNDFDPSNPRDPQYLEKNNGYLNAPIVLKNGDIAVPIGTPVAVGCKITGLDVNKIFPSAPTIHHCAIVARGTYNKDTERYDFTFSDPVILSDLRSSRGIDEPILEELESGRMLLVMRGSNVCYPNWNTRIQPGTPAFKWYSYSDNGGVDFTPAEPWHFDDKEVIYSSATISCFKRSSKNGKLYWFGNITDHTAYGNYPRFPLYIAEVDEDTGLLKKESLTLIDTRQEGESEKLQLSNFQILEDRETLKFELTLCKIQQYDPDDPWFAEGWLYEIDVDA